MWLLVMHCNKHLEHWNVVTTDKSHTTALYSHKKMKCGGRLALFRRYV